MTDKQLPLTFPCFDEREIELVRECLQSRWVTQGPLVEKFESAVAGLHAALPGIALDAPRDAAGGGRPGVLTESERAGFRGVLGHYHLSDAKVDPGPGFDWDRVLGRARAYADVHGMR